MKRHEGSEEKAFQSVLEAGHIEVEQETVFDSGKFHVGQNLGFMNLLQLVDALELQYDLIFNKNIHPVSTIQVDALVFHRQWMLNPELDPVQIQLVSQALLIGRLQQPWPQFPVNLNRTPNCPLRQLH